MTRFSVFNLLEDFGRLTFGSSSQTSLEAYFESQKPTFFIFLVEVGLRM